jgi:hypothetical protein
VTEDIEKGSQTSRPAAPRPAAPRPWRLGRGGTVRLVLGGFIAVIGWMLLVVADAVDWLTRRRTSVARDLRRWLQPPARSKTPRPGTRP